tara:strand:- start:5695 stop:6426 length:732 start_codon:yes stop_codon:yes gene_type:complete
MKKFIFASDLHGDVQDPESVDVLLKYVDIYSPDVRVFGGDLFDFRNIRRGAGAAEKQDSMAADVEAGLDFLNRFKPNVLLLGNHDKRLWDTAEYHTHGIVQDAARQGVRDIMSKCRKLKCKVIPYNASNGYYDIGLVRFIHGYHAGIYATKKHAEVYSRSGGVVLHGHTHAIQYHSIPKVNGGAGMGVGCLAQTDMSYNRHMTGRIMHENGFAYGYVDGKEWQVFQAKKGKKWHLMKEIISLG